MLRTITEEPVPFRFSAGGTLVYWRVGRSRGEVEASNAEKRNESDGKANLADVAERDTF